MRCRNACCCASTCCAACCGASRSSASGALPLAAHHSRGISPPRHYLQPPLARDSHALVFVYLRTCRGLPFARLPRSARRDALCAHRQKSFLMRASCLAPVTCTSARARASRGSYRGRAHRKSRHTCARGILHAWKSHSADAILPRGSYGMVKAREIANNRARAAYHTFIYA